jgi:hypothetical protein
MIIAEAGGTGDCSPHCKGMIMIRAFLVCCAALLGASGCSVAFYGSAPATPGNRYVVGAKQGFLATNPAMYICPDKKSGECQQIEVTVTE